MLCESSEDICGVTKFDEHIEQNHWSRGHVTACGECGPGLSMCSLYIVRRAEFVEIDQRQGHTSEASRAYCCAHVLQVQHICFRLKYQDGLASSRWRDRSVVSSRATAFYSSAWEQLRGVHVSSEANIQLLARSAKSHNYGKGFEAVAEFVDGTTLDSVQQAH